MPRLNSSLSSALADRYAKKTLPESANLLLRSPKRNSGKSLFLMETASATWYFT